MGITIVHSSKRNRAYSRIDIADRLWAKVAKTDECWEWTGYIKPNGYASLYDPHTGTKQYIHRISWELHNGGPIPDGMMVCHRCDNRRCVRPDHLFLGTARDNVVDQTSKGRNPFQLYPERARVGLLVYFKTNPGSHRGQRNPHAKLSAVDVATIRSSPDNNATLSRRFGVTPTCIGQARRGQTWCDIL